MLKHQETTERAFRREMECLDLFRCIRHSNIVELLGSYTHRTEHNLLFPLYPLDLSSFIESDERYGDFIDNITFYSALTDLSSAIETIHNLSVSIPGHQKPLSRIGYHHDIRPKNILVSRSTFILADFGLARFKEAGEDSKTRWKSGIGDYIAPECMDEEFNHQQTGRSIDIWSFGCLVAEIATYMEGGPSLVARFRRDRVNSDIKTNWTTFYFFEGSQVRSTVKAFLKILSEKPSEQGIRSLAKVAGAMLQVKEGQRPNAAAATCMLGYVNLKALYQASKGALRQLGATVAQSSYQTFPSYRLELWFEEERFKAWGKILGMDFNEIDCALLKDQPTIGAQLRSILLMLHKCLVQSLKESEDPRRLIDHDNEINNLSQPSGPRIRPEEIRRLVKELWEAVPLQYQKRMEQAWRESVLETGHATNLGRIEQETKEIYGDKSEIGVQAALKRLQSALWRELDSASPRQKELILRNSQVERTGTLNNYHELGWYRPTQYPHTGKPQKVLIEWMLYSPIWAEQTDEEKVLKVATLAELLHYPKPKGFHVLDCVGVIPPTADEAHEGFGFVYSFPTSWSDNSNENPRTLLKMLHLKGSAIMLDDKFRIAACLASSIFELHSAGWLHKYIQSSNVLLFSDKRDRSDAIGDPYLVGMRHSRPDGTVWISDTRLFDSKGDSDDPARDYIHPQYTPGSTRFDKRFDFYSVGVVLLEIGFWEPLSSFRAQHMSETHSSFSRLLIERYTPKLGPKMGSSYRDVVRACLEGEFGIADEEPNATDDLAGFYWNVVTRLADCKVGH